MAATKTAQAPARRAKAGKTSGAARTATRQPSSANGSNAEPAVLEEILEALVAARDGDFSKRLSRRRRGLLGEIGSAYNELVAMNARMVRPTTEAASVLDAVAARRAIRLRPAQSRHRRAVQRVRPDRVPQRPHLLRQRAPDACARPV